MPGGFADEELVGELDGTAPTLTLPRSTRGGEKWSAGGMGKGEQA
jgi:hypothetical protein